VMPWEVVPLAFLIMVTSTSMIYDLLMRGAFLYRPGLDVWW
jgi:hypothetical protein